MARRVAIPYQKMALKIVGSYQDYLAARIQRLDFPVNINSTDINELGNPNKAGSVEDVPEVTATFQAMDTSIKIFAALTGNDPTNYPAEGVESTELGEVDLIGVVKDDQVSDYVKSVHVRRAQVTDFTFSYSVDGESTEEYTVSGNEKRWFKYDVIVDTFDDTEASSSPVTLTETPIQLKNNDYALSVILDGVYLEEVTSGPSTGEYAISGTDLSFADTVSTMLVAVYHANPSGNNWSDVSDDTIPAAIFGKDVPVTIAANSIPRVQSVTIRGTFPNTVVKEQGNRSVVGTIVQPPEINGDIEVLDTDHELIALLTTGELNPSGVTEFGTSELTASGLSLVIELYDPASSAESPTTLKTVYIPEITVTSEGHTTNVGENATQTFGFKSTEGILTVYSGSM